MYVVIHEFSHILNVLYGHGELFWKINNRLLRLAMENNIYLYEDYKQNPLYFGVVKLDYNILEDYC